MYVCVTRVSLVPTETQKAYTCVYGAHRGLKSLLEHLEQELEVVTKSRGGGACL